MGADKIQDKELKVLNIEIVETTESGSRKLKIPKEHLSEYIELKKNKLAEGFWNEIVGADEILFIFKFKDGSVKEYKLSPDNESEISENDFYHDFMLEHYPRLINRNS